MTIRRQLALGAVVTGLAIFVLGMLLMRFRALSEPTSPELNVPAAFKSLRDSFGHVVHIHRAKLACDQCHDLDREGFKTPGDALCERCHGEGMEDRHATIHAMSPLGQAVTDCRACHTFTMDRSIDKDNCVRCHAQPQGSARAIVTHSKARCAECHRPHSEPSLVPRPCEDCHEDQGQVHHGKKAADAMLCLDCHSVHDEKQDADRRCAACHQPIAKTAIFRGHDACVNCHKPHEFTVAAAKDCVACHTDKPPLAAAKVAKHRNCESCHAKHDQRNPSEAACAACHGKIKLNGHPAKDNGGKCIGCHPAHEKGTITVGCPTCHTKAVSMTSFHAPTVACVDCHKPHSFGLKATDARLCAGCHKEEKRLTDRAKSGGHAKCTECHRTAPHQPKAPPRGCIECHDAQRSTAPKGHADCKTCHVLHSGDLLPGLSCATCHEAQKKGPHVNVKGGCVNCHRPHGPKGPASPPTCASCHAPSKLPGLHQVAEHQTCSKCHQPHGNAPLASRKSCTVAGCHAQVMNQPVAKHEPTAAVCAGCHTFLVTKAAP